MEQGHDMKRSKDGRRVYEIIYCDFIRGRG